MTTTAAAADQSSWVELAHDERDRGGDRSDDHAPGEDGARANVKLAASVVGSRLHDITVFSVLAVVQLVWLAALGYALSSLA